MNHERITPIVSGATKAPVIKPAVPSQPVPVPIQVPKPATRAVRAGIENDQHYGAVIPPLHLSSNFTFMGLGEKREYDYTRSGNPTRDLLGDALCDLEGGTRGLVTSSGMSAVHLALQLVPPGHRVVAPHDCYGGTFRLLESAGARRQFEVEFVDQTDLDALETALVGAALRLWLIRPELCAWLTIRSSLPHGSGLCRGVRMW